MSHLQARLVLVCALLSAGLPAQAQLVPMIGAAAIQSGATVINPAPGLIQDARQTVGAYNQRSGVPLPGGSGAMPIQGGGDSAQPATPAAGNQTAEATATNQGASYVVNGQMISPCSSGMACLHQLRRAMGVAP